MKTLRRTPMCSACTGIDGRFAAERPFGFSEMRRSATNPRATRAGEEGVYQAHDRVEVRERVQAVLRRSGLLESADKIRHRKSVLQLRRKNRHYLDAHPDFAVPPTRLAFDAYSTPDWEF